MLLESDRSMRKGGAVLLRSPSKGSAISPLLGNHRRLPSRPFTRLCRDSLQYM
jgi:hypothetical protein